MSFATETSQADTTGDVLGLPVDVRRGWRSTELGIRGPTPVIVGPEPARS